MERYGRWSVRKWYYRKLRKPCYHRKTCRSIGNINFNVLYISKITSSAIVNMKLIGKFGFYRGNSEN